MERIKVTPAQLKALVKGLDGRQTWTNPVTVTIDGNELRLLIPLTGEIRMVNGIIPVERQVTPGLCTVNEQGAMRH